MKYPPKQSTINYRKFEKMQKMFPQGIVVDGVDLLKVIDNLHNLAHEFRNKAHWGELNPKETGVRDSELWQMIRDCYDV